MGNRDTKTDYQEVVSVGDQKWETAEITIRIIFFVWDSYSLFLYIQRIFKSHLKKITYTQRANCHPKSQYDLSPCYINLLKNGSIPPLHHPGGEGMQTMKSLWICQCIFLVVKNHRDYHVEVFIRASLNNCLFAITWPIP